MPGNDKLTELKEYLKSLGSVAVAFSGGVDSTFLLKAARDALGERAVAVTAKSSAFPERELKEAGEFCRWIGVRQVIFEFDMLKIPGVPENPPNRCYLCKKELLGRIIKIAQEEKLSHVAEGSNMDDVGDYRPGMAAVSELGVKSPLQRVGLYKEEIRNLSRELGLPAWEKPSFACLASRFAYGGRITEEKLAMAGRAEQFLLEKGFRQVRVRVYGSMASIEVMPEELERLLAGNMREAIVPELKACGFTHVSVDLEGYRTGSMNGLKREFEESGRGGAYDYK